MRVLREKTEQPGTLETSFSSVVTGTNEKRLVLSENPVYLFLREGQLAYNNEEKRGGQQ